MLKMSCFSQLAAVLNAHYLVNIIFCSKLNGLEDIELLPGAKIVNVFRAWIGAQLTICAQK